MEICVSGSSAGFFGDTQMTARRWVLAALCAIALLTSVPITAEAHWRGSDEDSYQREEWRRHEWRERERERERAWREHQWREHRHWW